MLRGTPRNQRSSPFPIVNSLRVEHEGSARVALGSAGRVRPAIRWSPLARALRRDFSGRRGLARGERLGHDSASSFSPDAVGNLAGRRILEYPLRVLPMTVLLELVLEFDPEGSREHRQI